MRERPILFSGPMVRAILEGRKTQTRRVLKPGAGQQWLSPETVAAVKRWEHRKDGWWAMAVGDGRRIVHCGVDMDGGHIGCVRCPFGQPGDQLWVRETWLRFECPGHQDRHVRCDCQDTALVRYATDSPEMERAMARWRPSIHMPRWASRLTLEVRGVRVERLQDISEEDAKAEGVERSADNRWWLGAQHPVKGTPKVHNTAAHAFADVWDSINGERQGCAWASNSWVWCIDFRRLPATASEGAQHHGAHSD